MPYRAIRHFFATNLRDVRLSERLSRNSIIFAGEEMPWRRASPPDEIPSDGGGAEDGLKKQIRR